MTVTVVNVREVFYELFIKGTLPTTCGNFLLFYNVTDDLMRTISITFRNSVCVYRFYCVTEKVGVWKVNYLHLSR